MSDEPLCGPWEGGLNRIVPQATFGIACRIHDEDYTTNPAGISRREADERFRVNMSELADEWWHVPLSWVYWGAVRAFGWAYYKGKS